MPTIRKASEATALTGANVAVADKIFILDPSDTTDETSGTTKAILAFELAPQLAMQAAGTAVRYVSASFTGMSAPYYTTITLALAAATSGDLIVIYPGTYDEQLTLVTGVNLHFLNGAIVDYTGTGNVAGILDNGSDVTCTISGNGQFKRTPTSGGGTAADLLSITGTNSNITVWADLLEIGSSGGSIVEVTASASIVRIYARRANGSGTGINAFQFKISSALRVIIHCWEVFKPSSASGVLQVPGAAVVYFTADYVESAEDSAMFAVTSASAEVYLRINRSRNTNTGNITGAFVSCSNGTISVFEGEFICDSTGTTSCVSVTGGVVRMMGTRVYQLGDSANADVISKSGGTLVLSNASLIATNASSESITAGTAQDVSVYGDCVANRDKNANVTIRVGTLTVDTTYVV